MCVYIYMYISTYPIIYPPVTHHLPVIYPSFTHHFPMISRCFSPSWRRPGRCGDLREHLGLQPGEQPGGGAGAARRQWCLGDMAGWDFDGLLVVINNTMVP